MTSPLPQGGLSVERLCALAGVSRAGYYRHWRASVPRQDETAVRDAIQRIALANRRYGYRRIAAELRRQGLMVNRKRVLRLTRQDNLLCLRARPFVPRTTESEHGWQVVPNLARGMITTGLDQLWVADITYVATWSGFAYVAFVTDVFSRRIVGWRVSSNLRADLALDALEMAIWSRKDDAFPELIHHSDRGCQYLSIRYTERLADIGAAASVGSRGDSYDNALAESVFGLYKAELITMQAPWRTVEDVELATLSWVHWWNTARLHSAIDNVPPAEYEAAHYAAKSSAAITGGP
jgi:putative transposase